MWRKDIIMCDLFGNKKKLDACTLSLGILKLEKADLIKQNDILKEQLAICTPPPAPVLEQHIKSADWVWMQLMELKRQGCELDIEPLVDEKYRVLSEADFKIAIRFIGIHQWKYEPIWRDCDDYAEIAPALLYMEFDKLNSAGQCLDWHSRHAYNIAVVLEGPGIWEPQAATFTRDIAGRNQNLYGMKKSSPNNGYIQL